MTEIELMSDSEDFTCAECSAEVDETETGRNGGMCDDCWFEHEETL